MPKVSKSIKKTFLLQLFILVIIRHFHCKIYRNLSKIWKKRLVQVKHIYSGSSFFPGNKIASVYRSWHRFCYKSRFSEKSKITSNDEILREIYQESILICTLCLAIEQRMSFCIWILSIDLWRLLNVEICRDKKSRKAKFLKNRSTLNANISRTRRDMEILIRHSERAVLGLWKSFSAIIGLRATLHS